MIGYIYLISSKRSDGGIYVGQTMDLDRRKQSHISFLQRNKHDNIHLQNSWNKYGANDFVFIEAEQCLVEKLTEREQVWIDTLKVGNIKVYNISPAGRPPNNKGRVHSDRSRYNMSQAAQKKTISPDGYMKLSLAGKAHMGKIVSKETRLKLSAAAMGNQKGRTSFLGKRHTEESRKKISEAQIGRKISNETRSKKSEAMRQYWAKKRNSNE